MTKQQRRRANRDNRAQRLSARREDKAQSTRNRQRRESAWKQEQNTQEVL